MDNIKFNKLLNNEVVVHCVMPYSTFHTVFTGILLDENYFSITLENAEELEQPTRKYKKIIIRKDTIVSIGQKYF